MRKYLKYEINGPAKGNPASAPVGTAQKYLLVQVCSRKIRKSPKVGDAHPETTGMRLTGDQRKPLTLSLEPILYYGAGEATTGVRSAASRAKMFSRLRLIAAAIASGLRLSACCVAV